MKGISNNGVPVVLHCWSCNASFSLKERADCDGCCWKCGVEIDLDEYAEEFAAEVERLRKACEAEFRSVEVLNEANQKLKVQLAESQAHAARLNAEAERHARNLAEAQALLRDIRQCNANEVWPVLKEIDEHLSACVDPKQP